MKRKAGIFLVMFLAVSLTMSYAGGGSQSSGSASSGKEVLVWHWGGDAIRQWGAEFEKSHPQYHVVNEDILASDMINRFNNALASGGRVPDVLTVEWSISGIILSKEYDGLIENIKAPPYNMDPNRMVDWVAEICTAYNGELRGVEVGPAPTTLAYTKSVAKQFLGTDDANLVYNQLDSWNKVLEAGRKIKNTSNGTKYLATDISQFAIEMLMADKKATVQDGKIVLRRTWKETFDFLYTLEREGLVRNLTEPAAITDAMANNPDTYLLWKCSMWEPRWTFFVNAPKQVGTFATLPSLPGGTMAVGGGVLFSVPTKARNKEGGFAFIDWLRNSKEGSAFQRDTAFDVASIKECYADPSFHTSPKDLLDYFGGFDVIKQFASMIDQTKANYKTAYDGTIWGQSGSFTLALQALRSGRTADEALTIAVNELKRIHPELTE